VRRPGFVVHQFDQANPPDTVFRCGVQVSSPTRCAIELAGVVSADELELALDYFLMERLTAVSVMFGALERYGSAGRKGTAHLRRLLIERRDGQGLVASWLEQGLVAAIRRCGLPPPTRNFELRSGGRVRRLDLAWPTLRVAVEAMGARWHGSFGSQIGDVQRERSLTVDGWQILMATVADRKDPTSLLDALAIVLKRAEARVA
jgi:hypothetical protein